MMYKHDTIRLLEKDVLAHLSSELDRFSSEELRDVSVVVPTQRLGQYLLAMLGKKRGTFLAPSILTLESFIQQHSPLHLKSANVLSTSAEELLLASLIKQGKFRHLQKGHEHEIREFFSQMEQCEFDEPVTPSVVEGSPTKFMHTNNNSLFLKLRTLIQKDIYKDESHIGSLIERVDELSVLYKHYRTLLTEKNVLSAEQHSRLCVQELINQWKDTKSLKATWTYFACFTTVKAYCRKLLKLLSQKENSTFLFSNAPRLFSTQNPLQELIEYLLDKPIETSQEELPLVQERTRIVACNSIVSETEEALACIRSYIEQGCPESRIALLISDENIYGHLLTQLLKKESFGYNLAIAQNFSKCTEFGSWLYSLFSYLLSLRNFQENAKEQQSLFRNFVSHPLTWKTLSPDRKEEDWLLLQYDLVNINIEDQEHPFLTELLKKLSPLISLFKSGKRESLRIWQAALMHVIEDFAKLEDTASQEAFHQFCEFFEQWAQCWEDTISGSECFSALKDKLQSLETRSIGFPLEGVQILSVIEARYVPFDVVIVLGCVEGRFPRALPNDRLVSDLLKVKLGMPGWQYIEALEDTTFHLLCQQAQYFSFIYSVSPDYGNVCRSRFVERLLSQNKAILHTRKDIIPSREFVEANTEILGHYEADRYPLFEQISASSLSQVFRCPYQFLLSKLGVKAQEEDSPALWEGRWMHEILEAFYTGIIEKKKILEALPLRLTLNESEIIPYALQRLQTLTEVCLPENIKGSPFHLHLLHFSWPRFAEHWSKFFEQTSEKEWTFENKTRLKEFPLTGKGLPLHDGRWSSLLGTLDSFEEHPHGHILVDYKRKHVDTVSDLVKGLSPQLPLYALALAQNHFDETLLDKSLVGYWNILEGRWHARAIGEGIKTWSLKKKLASYQTPVLGELVQTLQNLWNETVQNLLKEQKEFKAVESDLCEFCPFTGICRTPQNRLETPSL